MKNTLKKVTSLSLGFSFLIMSYTGIILFLVPKGKIAYWVDWHLFGLSKSQYGEPPYGHAEETKLKKFCKRLDIDYDKASKILTKKGFIFKADDTLLDISKKNATTPAIIYNLLIKLK